jgi:hypothetical protein
VERKAVKAAEAVRKAVERRAEDVREAEVKAVAAAPLLKAGALRVEARRAGGLKAAAVQP